MKLLLESWRSYTKSILKEDVMALEMQGVLDDVAAVVATQLSGDSQEIQDEKA